MTNPKFAQTSDSGRYYDIPGYEGQVFYSVTTVLNVISKPALVPWAAKLAAERAYELIGPMIINRGSMKKEDLSKSGSVTAVPAWHGDS